jgi:glycosyltransferase involved in cell wall biosynthesis
MPPLFIWHGLPELTWDIVRSHYLPLMRSGGTRVMPEFLPVEQRPRLLIISNDIVDNKMAGPGVRYLEMARALSTRVEVTLAVPSETNLQVPPIRMVRWDVRSSNLQALVEKSDIVLISGNMAVQFPFLQNSRTRIVVDLYDPMVLENLHYYMTEPLQAQESLNRQAVEVTNSLARIGDFFICGSKRQRDFWIGVLAANARINPHTFAQDASLGSLIDIVGIGFPDREPIAQPMLRGVHPSFPEDCRIVLWGGGIWNWLDPLTLIQAWPEVLAKHPEARLVFLGTRHPNPLVPRHAIVERAETLAVELGEKDRTIFFFEWLPYQERERLLCEADIGVTLHPLHVETRYSIRTRVLDYFWARLPVLITEGDITSEWVKHYGLGMVVPPLNSRAVANTLCDMLDRPKRVWGPAFESLPGVFSWSHVVEPLMQYCLHGKYAADRTSRQVASAETVWKENWRERIGHAVFILRTEGFRMFMHRAWRYAQWRLAKQWS